LHTSSSIHSDISRPQQVIHHYSQTIRTSIPPAVLKSLIYQLFSGLLYLHQSHILHRDLKPANILITSAGVVKIGDLGLARLTHQPLLSLYSGDKVVVTIWYRAPELLLGSKHYHTAVDCWAVGCVLAELASLRPIFKGEEAKLDSKKNVPFQKDQMLKILEVLGSPTGARPRSPFALLSPLPRLLIRPSLTLTRGHRTRMVRPRGHARVPQPQAS
jgi:cyclin-dependent kinase 8/11